MKDHIERHFIWIILLFSCSALFYPDFFISVKEFIPIGLGLIMFGIGINTPIYCFTKTLAKPQRIAGLILFRYMLMPFGALIIAYAFHLTQDETIGLLVLGTSPGGTAANVMAYLSKSNVALAVLLTFGTTLLSPIATPTLIYLLLHENVTVHFWPMVLHIGSIILLPITAGLFLNYFKISIIEKIKSIFPVFSILLIALIIASIFALNQQILLMFPVMAMFAVIALNLLGYFTGAFTAYLLKQDQNSILATAFDYGMFDAVIAMVICTTFFSKEAAIPAVLISIIQNITASVIVKYKKKTSQFQIQTAKY